MYCPEQIVYNSRRVLLMCHTSTDWIQGAPKRELFNPLRYSVTFNPGTPSYRTINDDGKAWIAARNLWFRIRRWQ